MQSCPSDFQRTQEAQKGVRNEWNEAQTVSGTEYAILSDQKAAQLLVSGNGLGEDCSVILSAIPAPHWPSPHQ